MLTGQQVAGMYARFKVGHTDPSSGSASARTSLWPLLRHLAGPLAPHH
jgi:hypothetical protein